MPHPLAQLTKAALRQLVAFQARVDHGQGDGNDWWPESASGAGNAGGTTAVFSSLIGSPRSSFINKYLLLTSGTYAGQWRIISDFTSSTGTITVARAFGGQVASGVTVEIHDYRPDLYTLAINEALRVCYPTVYRPILHHSFIRSGTNQRTIATPRNVRRVLRVLEDRRSSERLKDYFDRSNSTTDPGSKWTASVGTWGITSESLYAPGDTDADRLLAATNPQVKNGVIQAVVRGDTTDGASRVLSLLFRYEDSSNYLAVRLLNGVVDLRKVDGGTESSLTTGTVTTTENVDYVVRVMFDGAWIRVWVDDVEYITYQLLGLNLKYLGYDESGTGTFGNVGFRLDKTGSPSLAATATLARDYFCHELVGTNTRDDWEQSYDSRSIKFNRQQLGLSEGRMLWIEGVAPLTALAEDTTFGTLATDTTTTVEVESADDAIEVLVAYAKYALYRQVAKQEEVKLAYALAQEARNRHAMPWPEQRVRHP